MKRSIMLTIVLLIALNASCQTISIPATQAKEITKGLISEEKLRKENKILKLEIINFREIKIKQDTIIFDLKEQVKISETQLENLNKQLKLTIDKYNIQKSNTGLKSIIYGLGGGLIGIVTGLLIAN